MRGAEALVQTLVANGVEVCFANPGTSEMHFVAALDGNKGVHCSLVLFEGVATGAADGYARLAGKPAATLLHCGPGLANGLANLHNAHRASVPIVNIVGDQATYHRPYDPPLAADTEGWARGVSSWVRVCQKAQDVGKDAAEAIRAAKESQDVATLILPSDTSWSEGGVPAGRLDIPRKGAVAGTTASAELSGSVSALAQAFRSGEPTALLVGSAVLETERGLRDAHRIAAVTGARLFGQTFNRRIARGRGRPAVLLLPYAVDRAVAALAGIKHLVLVDCEAPVGFFAYPGKPSLLYPPEATVHRLPAAALSGLAAEFPERGATSEFTISPRDGASELARILTDLIPENAIVVDESVSVGISLYPGTFEAAPHDWLQTCGGSIGEGMPMATGAAMAASGRRVINLEGDGSALYTVQSLWTQAREKLDVTTVILSNRKYAILEMELRNVGANPGRTALDLFDLSQPSIDWVALARGLGVEGATAGSLAQFRDLLKTANQRKGPFLIELTLGS